MAESSHAATEVFVAKNTFYLALKLTFISVCQEFNVITWLLDFQFI